MGFDPAIRAKVRKLALDKKSKLTAKDVLMSEELKSYLSSLAVSMGNGAGETNAIIVDDGGRMHRPDIQTAHGCISTARRISSTILTISKENSGLYGNFFHEKAHDLFNDFNEFRNAMRYIDSGHFYGERPQHMDAKQEADWTDMEDALQTQHTRQIFRRFTRISTILSRIDMMRIA